MINLIFQQKREKTTDTKFVTPVYYFQQARNQLQKNDKINQIFTNIMVTLKWD